MIMKRLGLVVNPVAGMGGSVGLKGTDGVVEEALARGASRKAPRRAMEALARLTQAFSRPPLETSEVTWLVGPGAMGEDIITSLENLPDVWEVNVITPPSGMDGPDSGDEPAGSNGHSGEELSDGGSTTAEDTRSLVREFKRQEVDLVIFCGGDGTARDVFEAAGDGLPILGIPSGVKMHSGVFATTPEVTGILLEYFLRDELTIGEGEVLDLDETLYRDGTWEIAFFGTARTVYEPNYVQVGKSIVEAESADEALDGICDEFDEWLEDEPDSLFILGPGGTMEALGNAVGAETTHLGVDILQGDRVLARDVRESSILEILDAHGVGSPGGAVAHVLVSPIGGQGFFLGRGNLQISASVIRRVGLRNIHVYSIPEKLARMDHLRVDTGDPDLDREFRDQGSWRVTSGYRFSVLKKMGQ